MIDPVPALLRALKRSAAAAGCTVDVGHDSETPWATATFTGARHILCATAEEDSLRQWLATLPEAELPLHGWFVASCAAEAVGNQATIELLVLQE